MSVPTPPVGSNAVSRISRNDVELWFVAGTADSGLQRYGLIASENVSSGAISATKATASSVVTATGNIFTSKHIGRTIKTSSGQWFAIVGYTSATQVTVLGSGSFTAETFTVIPAVWHRDGEAYDSVLESGLDDFNAPHYEKILNSYVLIPASQSPNTPVTVAFLAGVNPSQGAVKQSALISSPNTNNLLKPTLMAHYIGDRVTVSGINNPFELQERVLMLMPRQSNSWGRRGNGT